MGFYNEKEARNRAVLGALHPGMFESESPPAEAEGPPDFDGGVRKPAPGPSDPAAEHSEMIADLFGPKQVSHGPLGWQVED
jgi:hypothetical protein